MARFSRSQSAAGYTRRLKSFGRCRRRGQCSGNGPIWDCWSTDHLRRHHRRPHLLRLRCWPQLPKNKSPPKCFHINIPHQFSYKIYLPFFELLFCYFYNLFRNFFFLVHYHPLQPTEPEIIAICSSHIHFFPSLIFPFQQQSKQNTKFLFFLFFFCF